MTSVSQLRELIHNLHQVAEAHPEQILGTAPQSSPALKAVAAQAQAIGADPEALLESVKSWLSSQRTREPIRREQISEIVLSSLLDEVGPNQQGKRRAGRHISVRQKELRQELQGVGQRFGQALTAIGSTIEATGLGVSPTLPQLADELAQWQTKI